MRIIIFDTETIGKVSQDLINIGYKIVDLHIQDATYTTLCERDYLITRLINNEVYCINDDFVGASKYAMWLEALSTHKAVKRELDSVLKTLNNDLKKYGVLFGYAYNCDFDLDKFAKAYGATGLPNPFETLPVYDIWAYAYKYICTTEDYKQWCKSNEVLTKTGQYIATSVEGVCKYLYDNVEFTEDHTALSDVQHETYILCECVRRSCDITRPLPRAKYITSDKEFEEVIVLPTGQEVNIHYTKKFSRGNKTTYK